MEKKVHKPEEIVLKLCYDDVLHIYCQRMKLSFRWNIDH